ncbi:MAG: hypothetical protein JWQ16_1178 [Novosphingobium sp.]|nr:hypothetical protein [Novosphingobium sp.]
MRSIWGFAAALVIAGHSYASEVPACPVGEVAAPPAEFSRWGNAAPLVAATTPAEAQRRVVPLGIARKLTLAPGSAVRNAAAPERSDAVAGDAGRAGMIAFDIATAGVYRVALSAGSWIEVVRDGKTEKSVAHAHGPACGTIRKIVDFQLAPGRYVLQLTGSTVPEVTVMIAPAARTATGH